MNCQYSHRRPVKATWIFQPRDSSHNVYLCYRHVGTMIQALVRTFGPGIVTELPKDETE